MKKRLGGAAALVAALLIGVSPASAATEIGSDCQANNGAGGYTFVQLKKVAGAPPIAAPTAGVVTKWKVNSAVPAAVGQKLQILRPTGNPNEFTTVAESTPATVSQGANSFDTRLPIQAGDRPAAAGAPSGSVAAPLYCSTTSSEDVMGALTPESALGSTNLFPPAPNLVAAISAVVEPDADNDGFGDETQDQCPQSATTQAPCPTISLKTSTAVKKGLATVLVTASSQASVTVKGKASLGKGKSAKLNGGTQIVPPGTFAKFTLLFPKALRSALKALPSNQSLNLKVTVSAPNIVGAASKKILKLHLRGQAKPKRRGHKK